MVCVEEKREQIGLGVKKSGPFPVDLVQLFTVFDKPVPIRVIVADHRSKQGAIVVGEIGHGALEAGKDAAIVIHPELREDPSMPKKSTNF